MSTACVSFEKVRMYVQSQKVPESVGTFVLRGELLHLGRQRFIEALLPAEQWLAHRVVIVAHHAGVTAHLKSKL